MSAPGNPEGELSLFKLALELTELGEDFDKSGFVGYYNNLVKQALGIAENSGLGVAGASADAIQLALAIARDSKLALELRDASCFDMLTSDKAHKIRLGMDSLIAA